MKRYRLTKSGVCDCMLPDDNGPWVKYEDAEQARREGWEQAKAEAKMVLCDICCYNSIDNPVPDECTYCNQHEAIASMTYKEAQDDK